MYGPQFLPATGCELGLLGLLLGASTGNWIITAISLLLLGSVALSLYRLRKGEQQVCNSNPLQAMHQTERNKDD